jgi:hypothetical protein
MFRSLLKYHVIVFIGIGGLRTAWCGEPQRPREAPSEIRVTVTRDTFVSNVGQEIDGNNGADPRLKIKSIQELTLLDCEAKPLLGRTVRKATLHLKLAGPERLLRVTVGTVGAEWVEGTGTGYAVQRGGATFRRRRHPDLAWSMGGGDLCDVILGNGGTSWRMADATAPDTDGWQHVPVDPALIAARVAGLCYGFVVVDDTGSEWTRSGESFSRRIFPNRFVSSRDENPSSAPYFTLQLGPDDRDPPEAPSEIRAEPQTATLPSGDALVSWRTPPDHGQAGTLGFFVSLDGRRLKREMIPLPAEPGGRVEMHIRGATRYAGKTVQLSVRAADAAGNLGPAATGMIRISDRIPTALPTPVATPGGSPASSAEPVRLPRLGRSQIAIIDELDKVNPVSGEFVPAQPARYLTLNHLWDAGGPRITLHAARNEFAAFQVLFRGADSIDSLDPQLAFGGAAGDSLKVEFGRYHVIPAGGGPMPDPIVPLALRLASRAGPVTSQSLHVEIYVPHDVAAGEHSGELILALRGGAATQRLRIPVSLQIWDFTLPDHLSFLPEMNCYNMPDHERDFYRLAHRHRTVLNVLPYYQDGRVEAGCVPRWNSQRRAFEWSEWDRRFGPLFDGSAFADLPRRRVPIECFYLPLHENWPSRMEGNYNGSYWADQAFPERYRTAFVATAREFAAHFLAKRWTETLFHAFLNNKVDFKERGWSRASSPWLLDEPANFQDFWAIRYFASAFHEGINQAWEAGGGSRAATPGSATKRPRMLFRADISRPQWQRDSLDGLLDYLVVSNAMRTYPPLVFERKRALGEIVLEYGGTNPLEGSNLQPAAWCLDAWTLGADGVLPWQTMGTAESWEKADELALFYPPRGQTGAQTRRAPGPASGAPVPSVRLKSYRRGQQDIEYLTLWSSLHNEPRWAIGATARAALKLAGQKQATGFAAAEDPGRIDYDRLRPGDLWGLRVALGAALSRAHPAPRQKLVDFRTPRRDPRRPPDATLRQ